MNFTIEDRKLSTIINSLEYQLNKKLGRKEYAILFQITPSYGDNDYNNLGCGVVNKSEYKKIYNILKKRSLKGEESKIFRNALRKLNKKKG